MLIMFLTLHKIYVYVYRTQFKQCNTQDRISSKGSVCDKGRLLRIKFCIHKYFPSK